MFTGLSDQFAGLDDVVGEDEAECVGDLRRGACWSGCRGQLHASGSSDTEKKLRGLHYV